VARIIWTGVVLSGLFLCHPAVAGEPATVAAATAEQVRTAVGRAAGYLRTESATWLSQRKCAACHHAPMPLWAMEEAGRQGYAVDRKFVADLTEGALGSREKMIASKIIPDPAGPPDPRPMGRGVSLGAVFMAAAAPPAAALTEGQKRSLRLIAADVVTKQQKDGSWEFFLRRPPINESQATDVAWIVMALQADAACGVDAANADRGAIDKGMAWLARAGAPDDQQVNALKVLVAARAGKAKEALRANAEALLAGQRSDGSWGQTAGADGDAFATGQTLYALALAGYTTDDPAVKRGIDFLVATQKSDGSWPMTSRATPDGRPGSAKLLTPITCAASAWATMGLARLVPNN